MGSDSLPKWWTLNATLTDLISRYWNSLFILQSTQQLIWSDVSETINCDVSKIPSIPDGGTVRWYPVHSLPILWSRTHFSSYLTWSQRGKTWYTWKVYDHIKFPPQRPSRYEKSKIPAGFYPMNFWFLLVNNTKFIGRETQAKVTTDPLIWHTAYVAFIQG